MKTIDSFISQEVSNRKIKKRIDRDVCVKSYYASYPELKELDEMIVEARRYAFLNIIRKQTDSALAFSKEDELTKARDRLLVTQNIDPDYDEEKTICWKCQDSGYIHKEGSVTKVCECMQNQLEACYQTSGMQDYESIRLTGYGKKYTTSTKREQIRLDLVTMLAMEDISRQKTTLCIYSDLAGTGKTYLSVCIAKVAIGVCKSAFYCKAEAFGDSYAEDYSQRMNDYKNCDVLVIDDFSSDATKLSKTASALSEILEVRGTKKLLTILTTRETIDSLLNDVDYRIEGKLRTAKILGETK